MEEEVINKMIYDDDFYINDCKSLKRRLTIVEKILLILFSLISFPIATLISKAITPMDSLSALGLTLWILSWIFCFFFLTFLEFGIKNISNYKGLLQSSIVSTFLSAGVYLSITAFFRYFEQQGEIRWTLIALISFGIYSVFVFISRVILLLIDKNRMKSVMIIGPKEDAIALARKLLSENKKNFKIRYLFYEIDGKISDYVYKKFKNVNQIILLNTLSTKNKEKYLLYFNSCLNKDVYLCTSYFDIILTSPCTQNIGDILSFEQKPFVIDVIEGAVKRIFDILICIVFLILTSIIWIIVPLCIKLYDGGPVFYKQVRLTKNMKEFNIIKFRSMRVDAEKQGGAQLAKAHDSRITPIGKIIRATRIDEIPQILNILKGDMSFVGPRPERPEFVEEFLKENELYKYRYNVKAGLTGLQQVKCTYHTDFNDKLRYDLEYIKSYSLALDLYIIFLTVKVCLSKGMAEGVSEDDLTFFEFLTKKGKEYNEHDDFLRILNHKRRIDDKTGVITPLVNPKKRKFK